MIFVKSQAVKLKINKIFICKMKKKYKKIIFKIYNQFLKYKRKKKRIKFNQDQNIKKNLKKISTKKFHINMK